MFLHLHNKEVKHMHAGSIPSMYIRLQKKYSRAEDVRLNEYSL